MKQSFLILLILFCAVLGTVALTINAKTQADFNLQQMGIESLVERHTFALEGSKAPELQPLGDTFTYKDHIYAIKQPGQFVIGAIVYSVLHVFGLSYVQNYILTSAWVTLLTSGAFVGFLAVAIYLVVRKLRAGDNDVFWFALIAVLATAFLPYAGVSHHDVYASAILFFGFALLFLYRRGFLAGFLVALTLFVSMLPITLCVGVGMWVLCRFPRRVLIGFLFGAMLGILPTLVFNAHFFGSPLQFANTLAVQDTNPGFSLVNIYEKLYFYLFSPVNSLWVFSPVLLLSMVGFLHFPKKFKSLAIFCCLLFVTHLMYLCSITTVGDSQYGPRYLLPVLPFLTLGLVGIRGIQRSLVLIFGSISFVIQFLGALGGVMYGTIWLYPVPLYWQQILYGEKLIYPVRSVGIFLILVAILLGIVNQMRADRGRHYPLKNHPRPENAEA